MRWLTLYLRSRDVPDTLVAVLCATVVLWVVDIDDVRLAAVAIGLGVAAAASGLGGADVALERTAAINWPPRRAAHLAGVFVIVSGLVLLTDLGATELVLRDAAGLTGLAALGAVLLGRQLAWVFPTAWTAVGVTIPINEVVSWVVQPPGTTAATITAAVLCGIGFVAYVAKGATFE
jgi:hypothetical protein